mgnify:CR=1 FL=1
MNIVSAIIIVISVVIGILYHEYGHLKAAKKHQINVNTFCIGLGKPFLQRKGKDGVTYGVAPIPLGGYCSIDDAGLNKSSLRVYISVLAAGIIRNMILGTVLIIIGQIIVANRFVNPIVLFGNTVELFSTLLFGLGDTVANMLDLKEMAAYGGFVGQMENAGTTIVSMSNGVNHVIGMSIMMGGLMNYMLAIFNALPLPGLDGGQILARMITDFCRKVFHREINPNIIQLVNVISVAVICIYQGLILLFDIPWVRNIFINL